jgi:pimeloyl-ACP methyl ester carboxylesterase
VSIDYRLVEVSREADWIVMVHGAFHSLDHLAPQQDIFTEEGYNTIAISLRKHGQSTTPQAWNEITLADYAEDVAVVLEQEGIDTFTFWAHSAGSLVVRRYAQLYGTVGVQKVIHAAPAPMSASRFNAINGYYYAAFPNEMQCMLTTFDMGCLRNALASTFTNNLSPAQWAPWEALLSENESIDAFFGAQALLGLDTFGSVPEVIIAPLADRTLPFAGIYDDAAVIGATVQVLGCNLGHDYWLDLPVCAKGR